MNKAGDAGPHPSDFPDGKVIFCVVPDDGTDKRVLAELRERYGLVRGSSLSVVACSSDASNSLLADKLAIVFFHLQNPEDEERLLSLARSTAKAKRQTPIVAISDACEPRSARGRRD